jgi:hypothetical protein
MKIYISGKISGLDMKDVEHKFNHYETIISCFGDTAINPLKLTPFLWIKRYWFFMISDLWALAWCDAIYLTYDWALSRGARIEMCFAILLGKKVFNGYSDYLKKINKQ